MNLNRLGDVVSGQGAGGVWVNGTILIPPPAGKPAWLTDHAIIFQTAQNELALTNLSGAVSVLDPQGATWIAACDGAWAAFVADGRSGVRTSWGLKLPEAAVLGMVPGVLFVKASYQLGGIWAYAVGETDPNKPLRIWSFAQPDILNDVPQFSALDLDRILWTEAGTLETSGHSFPAQVGAAFNPFMVDAGGQVYVGYHTVDGRFVLHALEDASVGCVVATGNTFGTIGQAVGNDGIKCLWATNPVESGKIESRIVRLSEDLQPWPVVREAIPVIGRPLWLGWFTFQGLDTDAPHNCDLRVDDPMYVTAGRKKIARWVSAPSDSDVDELERAIASVQAEEPSMPVIAYWTFQAQQIRVPGSVTNVGVVLGGELGTTRPRGAADHSPDDVSARARDIRPLDTLAESTSLDADTPLRTSGSWPVASPQATNPSDEGDSGASGLRDRRDNCSIPDDEEIRTDKEWALPFGDSNSSRTLSIGVEAYQHVDESLTAFEARLRDACQRCERPWIVAQSHTSNASLTKNVAALVPVYARVARDIPKVQGILAFSGSGRPTGWQDQSENHHDAWRALFHGIPSAPVIVVSPPPVTPPVTPKPPEPIPPPVVTPPAPPVPEEPEMKLPARCYVLLHNSNIAAAAPGGKLELNHQPQEYGGFQEVEILESKQSTKDKPQVLVRFIAANAAFRVDTVLALQAKYNEAISLWPMSMADVDSGWQNGVPSGPYIHYLGPDVDGRKGIVYTLTCVDKDGKLFR